MANNTDDNAPAQYKSLTEIRIRKDQILKSIRKDDEGIRRLWNSMFNKPETRTSKLPSKRISKLMNTGTGIVDGVLLAWKLYRKFKKRM